MGIPFPPTRDSPPIYPASIFIYFLFKRWTKTYLKTKHVSKLVLFSISHGLFTRMQKYQKQTAQRSHHQLARSPRKNDWDHTPRRKSVLPSGKNQVACWMMGSTTATTWTEVAAAISARELGREDQWLKICPQQSRKLMRSNQSCSPGSKDAWWNVWVAVHCFLDTSEGFPPSEGFFSCPAFRRSSSEDAAAWGFQSCPSGTEPCPVLLLGDRVRTLQCYLWPLGSSCILKICGDGLPRPAQVFN